jgi:hypothetical protein
MVISMTGSLCEGLCTKRRPQLPQRWCFSHLGHRQRLDDYQGNVADFAPVRPFNFRKIA